MTLKYAAYPGTVKLPDGGEEYVSASDLAEYYGLDPGDDYVVVEDGLPSPFVGTIDEASYVQLIPRADGKYPDIKSLYNESGEEYWDDDFDARSGDKWTRKQRYPDAP